jgi:transcriptional regulator with GAF, ATPase, and Fis domain
MAREQAVVKAFVALADTLVDDYDVIEFLQSLAERCVELLDVSEAGIMLADRSGRLRHAACSNERMRLVELLELQLEEGPCFDAYRGNEPVLCDTPEEAEARWPRFAPRARDAGFAAVSALPMRLRDELIGALNLFSNTPAALDDDDVRLAQAMADVATIGILQERAIHQARDRSSQLQVALESRVLIEQAKGVVAEHIQITVDEAFTMLRGFARGHNRLLSQVAAEVVEGSLGPEELVPAARSPQAEVQPGPGA